ncbi:MAG: hypothetical protein ACE5GE_05040, partial [Phycisphaerae bacterium]
GSQIGFVPRFWLLMAALVGVLLIGSVLRGGRRRWLLLAPLVVLMGAAAFLITNHASRRAAVQQHVVAIDARSEAMSGITTHVFESRFGDDDLPGEGWVFDTGVVRVDPGRSVSIESTSLVEAPGWAAPIRNPARGDIPGAWTAVSALALGVMVYLAYLFVDAGTRGQFTWRLRFFSVAAFVGICALLVNLAPQF